MSRAEDKIGRRRIYDLTRDWSFTYRPRGISAEGFQEPGCDDSRWRPVALPHTWQTWETTGQVHPFQRDPSELDDPLWWHGLGLYRKHFSLSGDLAGRKAFLEFDGVQKNCRVFLNGELCGEHAGGYTSFCLDISRAVLFGEENLLAVEVDSRRDDDRCTPPATAGNWNVYGGIHRPVRLVLTDPLHIPFQGNADHEGGTFITTPEITAEAARVHVRTWVLNEGETPAEFELRHTVFNPEGAECLTFSRRCRAEAGELLEVEQLSQALEKPRLWSPDEPNLYRCETTIFKGGEAVDSVVDPLGFRWFRWDYEEKRLYLNDRPVHLNGTNRHQEYPWLGDAVPDWIHQREMEEIKRDLGHNFIRTCHYTQAPLIYDLCDRLGILCCQEVPNIKDLSFDPDIQRSMVREMVRRDRNHPSIIMWSVGNETDHAADGDWVRAEDSTRIVHARHVYGGAAMGEPHNHVQIDMENLLSCTVRGWTDVESFSGSPVSGQATGTEVRQHEAARQDDVSVRGRIDRNNTIVWLYADHGADREYLDCPLKHVNPKGWVDAYRVPKYVYYLWQAHYASKLMVFAQAHAWKRANIGRLADIRVDSNGDEVELLVGGRSLGRSKVDASNFHGAVFSGVRVEDAVLKAVARRGNETVEQEIFLPGEPASLRLSASHQELPADRSGIALITVDILDAAGRPVPGAGNPLEWSLEGPGRLLAPAAWESQTKDRLADEGTMYICCPVNIPVRALASPGTIVVRCASPGLEPAEVHLEALPIAGDALSGLLEPALPEPGQEELAGLWGRPLQRGAEDARRPFAYEDLRLKGSGFDDYRAELDRLVRIRMPLIGAWRAEYPLLIDELANLAVYGRGLVIADDINSAIERYQARR